MNASSTYRAEGIVLRKTKLGETDLIVTLLMEDGSSVQAVAHGARKPSGAFASRLELCARVDVLLARGRSLDVVKEARTVCAHDRARGDLDVSACASAVIELAGRIAQPNLGNPRLYQCCKAALGSMQEAGVESVRAIAAASLLKELSVAGLRPSLSNCACCGAPACYDGKRDVAFSCAEGGYVCDECARDVDCVRTEARVCAWARSLLHAPFAEVASWDVDERSMREIVKLCQALVASHVGARLKSIDFMLSTWT